MTTLPELLVLTDRRQARASLLETVARAVEGGARAVVLREKDLGGTERAALAERLWELLEPVGGLLIAASWPVGPTTAVHLAAKDALPPQSLYDPVGRSCHDESEVDAASAEGLDYLTVSPVYATASKPRYGPSLGLDGLRALCARTPVPVYALGGVGRASAAACRDAGAAGVAVMGEVMRAPDPAGAVAAVLEALSSRSWSPSGRWAHQASKISQEPGGAA
ncbi:MAG: thiamine phosphate synthase [Micromonosporaceae bacterium]